MVTAEIRPLDERELDVVAGGDRTVGEIVKHVFLGTPYNDPPPCHSNPKPYPPPHFPA
jgi:hypothetical protein